MTLSSFTQGDFITCVLDMEARTISFGKNGEVFVSFLLYLVWFLTLAFFNSNFTYIFYIELFYIKLSIIVKTIMSFSLSCFH